MTKTVVIAEREYIYAYHHWQLCEELGFKVQCIAESAQQASERFKDLNPDALITDIDLMPGGDGVDVVEALRQHCPHVLVVFATGATPPHVLARIESTFPEAILTKPLTTQELRAVLLPGN